jgi:hypothetical protein
LLKLTSLHVHGWDGVLGGGAELCKIMMGMGWGGDLSFEGCRSNLHCIASQVKFCCVFYFVVFVYRKNGLHATISYAEDSSNTAWNYFFQSDQNDGNLSATTRAWRDVDSKQVSSPALDYTYFVYKHRFEASKMLCFFTLHLLCCTLTQPSSRKLEKIIDFCQFVLFSKHLLTDECVFCYSILICLASLQCHKCYLKGDRIL